MVSSTGEEFNALAHRVGGKAGVEIAAIGPLDDQSGQDPAPVRACIYTDPVRPFLDLFADRVTVNDDATMVGIVEQERLTNPTKIGLELLIQRHPRSDARMDEEIIAEPARIDEAGQKIAMPLRNGTANGRQSILVRQFEQGSRIDAIALQALRSSIAQPADDQSGLAVEYAKQDLFVIAYDEDRSNLLMPVGAQALDHLRAAGSPIDEVAEKDEQSLPRWPLDDITIYVRQKLIQQIQPTMDVADHVGALVARPGRNGVAAPHEVEDTQVPAASLGQSHEAAAAMRVPLNMA